jgi:uncharacterized protein
MLKAEDLIKQLNLVPHPEGGFFRETYRCALNLAQQALPDYYSGARSASTSIYYLLVPDTFSCMHRLLTDEVFHFYAGDPVEMLYLGDDERKIVTLGQDFERGQIPQFLVPAGVWQGSRLVAGGSFALLGCTVAPGFEFVDYTEGKRADLQRQFPAHAQMIEELTKK